MDVSTAFMFETLLSVSSSPLTSDDSTCMRGEERREGGRKVRSGREGRGGKERVEEGRGGVMEKGVRE